jgi:flagellar motor switch protein FliG
MSVVLGWLLLRRRRRRRRAAPRRDAAGTGGAAGLVPCDRQMPSDVPDSRDGQQAAFEFLGDIPPEELVGFLQGEHPQTLALILAHVPSRMAAQMLAVLPRDKQVEVSRRVVDLEQIDPEMVAEIEQALSARLAEGTKWQPVLGGLTSIAQILHHAGYATERTVLEALAAQQPALADRIRRRLFAFEDLAATASADLREALAGFDHSDLAVALRTASKDLKRKILSSLPAASARRVRREIDRIGPVRLSDVEAAQQRIVDAVRGRGGGRGSRHDAKAGTRIIA